MLHPPQTRAAPVPAAAPAPSAASCAGSPPSGCGQYYSPPRKYEDIKSWVLWWSWEEKENRHAHFSSAC